MSGKNQAVSCDVGIVCNADLLKSIFSLYSSSSLGLTGIVMVTVVPFPRVLFTEILPP